MGIIDQESDGYLPRDNDNDNDRGADDCACASESSSNVGKSGEFVALQIVYIEIHSLF